jgi:hypothetical protein
MVTVETVTVTVMDGRNGLERYGTIWNGSERSGTVRNDLERFGTIWNEVKISVTVTSRSRHVFH